jgi:hypothetical protein
MARGSRVEEAEAMIELSGLSRFCRSRAGRAMLAALLVVASGALASCNIIGAGCNGTSCDDVLTIYFDGNVGPPGGWFDGGTSDGGAPADAIEIDIEAEESQTFVPLETCWLTLGNPEQVVCDDGQGRLFVVESLTYSGFGISALRVTMSMNGTQLSQQVITPSYTTQSCACGAGTNHIGTATIVLPAT